MDVLWTDTNIFYNVLCFLITENEKLFDRNDSKLYWKTVKNIFFLCHHAYVGFFAMNLDLSNHYDVNVQTLYKYRVAYLTGWNFVFQSVFLSLALAYDILEWLDKDKSETGNKIRYYRDVLFAGIVFPYSLFVTTMFWTLFLIDRELVFPKVYDQLVPWWFNHCVHTNICVVLIIETMLQPRRRPVDRKVEVYLNAAVGIVYAIVYYSIFFFSHRWLYNVFGIMTWWQVVLYQCLIWSFSYVMYWLHYPINRLIHGDGKKDQKAVDEGRSVPENNWSLKFRKKNHSDEK